MSDKKKTIFSAILKSLKKVAQPFLSGKNTLDQVAAGLATTALLVQEVQAANKAQPSDQDALIDKNQPDQAADQTVDPSAVAQDDAAVPAQAEPSAPVVADGAADLPQVQNAQQAAADARLALRAVLEQAKDTGVNTAADSPTSASVNPSAESWVDAASDATVSSLSQIESAQAVASADLMDSIETASALPEITISPLASALTVALNPIADLSLLLGNPSAEQVVAISGQAAGPFQVGDAVTIAVNGVTYVSSVESADGAFTADVQASELVGAKDPVVSANITSTDASGQPVTATAAFPFTVNQGVLHLSGKAIDGYISGGHVFYDADGNGKMDHGEEAWQATTDANGNFDLTVDASHLTAHGHIVVQGGVDSFTGQQLSGDLISLAGSTLVTPLTTLLAFATQGPNAVTLEQAQAQFKMALGIDPSIDLSSYDPVAHMTSGDPADQLMAEHLFKAQQTIFTIMQANSALAEGDASDKIAMASKAVAGAIFDLSPEQAASGDLKANLGSIASASVHALLADDPMGAAKADAIVANIDAVNAAISDKYTGLAKAMADAQNGDADAIQQLADAKALAGVSQSSLLDAVSQAKTADSVAAIDKSFETVNPNKYEVDAEAAKNDGKVGVTLKDLVAKAAVSIDATSVAGGGAEQAPASLSMDLGETSGVVLGEHNVPDIFATSTDGALLHGDALDVTLNVSDAAQFHEVAGAADAVANAGVDTIQIDLTETASLDDLLNHGASLSSVDVHNNVVALAPDASGFSADLASLHGAGLSVNTIDVGGSSVDASIVINESQAGALIHDGLNFAANDHVTLDASSAQGTHLSNSLKELSKLGVDATSVAAGAALSVDLGGLSFGDLGGAGTGGVQLTSFTDASGAIGGSDISVSLDVANLGELHTAAQMGGELSAAGFDNVQINLADAGADGGYQDDLNALLSGGLSAVDANGQVVSLGQNSLSQDVASLQHAGLNVNTIDLGGNAADAKVSITDTQASGLIQDGLHFAAADHVTLDASSAQGTHLSNSLKELSKLGVDATSVAAGAALSVDLGGLSFGDLGGAGTGGVQLTSFTDASGAIGGSDISVSLDVANLGELHTAAQMGGELSAAGFDNVQINLADTGAAGYQDDLNALLSGGLSAVDANGQVVSLGQNALSQDVASLHTAGLNVNTIDLGGNAQAAHVNISEAQAHDLVSAGLQFAAQDSVNLELGGLTAADGTHVSGTHLKSSLQDLQKLGVDVSGQSINNLGVDAVGITGLGGLQDLNSLTASLKEAGVDHLGLHSSDFFANGQPTELLSAFENNDWLKNGVDITLEVDAQSTQSATEAGLSDNAALNALLNSGMVGDGQTWGTLLSTLHDAGLGNVEIESKANVHIADDLSAALFESGMLHALPDAHIEIDVAASTKLLSTSLKAMADLGVDVVHASDKVFVKLGVAEGELAGMHDLFSAFGLDTPATTGTTADHKLFDNSGKGAGLVLDQQSAKDLGITTDHLTDGHFSEAKVADLMNQLSKLGITEVDVVNNTTTQVFHIEATTVVAQTLPTVEVLGSDHADGHVFDFDIKNKPIGH